MKKKYHTKCFNNSSVDKKVVNGLLVRGNKQKELTKKGVNIRSKVFVSSKNTKLDVRNNKNYDHNENQVPSLSTHDMSTQVTHECEQKVVYIGPVDGGVGANDIKTHSSDQQGNGNCEGCEGGTVSHNKDMVKIFDIAIDDKYLNTLLSNQASPS